MEKFNGLEIVNKKILLGYTVSVVELDKKHIGKKKSPFYGLDNGPGLYWVIVRGTWITYFGPFRKSTAAFKDAEAYLENKEGEL